MGRGRDVSRMLQPIERCSLQSYLGTGLHTLGLLSWILRQTGPADVYVTTFSTSDAFLRGFLNLKKKGLLQETVLLADLKASRKTYRLYKEMQQSFDAVYLAKNHSKVVLVQNDRWTVTAVSSQNQTYGDRAECTVVTTSQEMFYQLYCGLQDIIDNHSIQLNGLFQRLTEQNKRPLQSTDSPSGDFRIIGY